VTEDCLEKLDLLKKMGKTLKEPESVGLKKKSGECSINEVCVTEERDKMKEGKEVERPKICGETIGKMIKKIHEEGSTECEDDDKECDEDEECPEEDKECDDETTRRRRKPHHDDDDEEIEHRRRRRPVRPDEDDDETMDRRRRRPVRPDEEDEDETMNRRRRRPVRPEMEEEEEDTTSDVMTEILNDLMGKKK